MRELNKRRIAARAELLQERIQNEHTGNGGTGDPCADEARREERAIGPEDVRAHVNVDDVEKYLDFDTWPGDEELPEWIHHLSDLITYLDDSGDHDDFEYVVPFEEIFSRVVGFSRRFIDDVETDRLSASAVQDLERHLLVRLSDIGAQALHVDFISYIAERDRSVVATDDRSPDSTVWYDRYVTDFLDGRATNFFEAYPVLARLLVTVARQWGWATSEFVSRLNDDYRAICSLLNTDDCGRVHKIDPGAGDPHEKGRTVFTVTFETGDELVYKPRNVDAENGLYEFTGWLNRTFDDVPLLRSPDLISQPTYGWVEKVSAASFSSEAALADYYRSVGSILCVLYVLNASDCHYENLIATKPSPVVVDAETILQTDVSTANVRRADLDSKVRQHVIASSLLKTLMLPFSADGTKAQTLSGLDMIEERDTKAQSVSWVHVNTDAMDVEYRSQTITANENFPTYENNPAPPHMFVEEIVDGFERTYDAISRHREMVKRKIDQQFEEIRVRNILRETTLYQALLETLSNPKYLRNGVRHGFKIRKTLSEKSFAPANTEQTDWLDAVVEKERKAVFRRDVPRFTMLTGEDGVYFGEAEVASDLFDETAMERVRSRLENMSDEDKKFQQGLIRACLSEPGVENKDLHGGN